MKVENKGKISYSLQAINIIPLLVFGLILVILENHWFTKTMYAEVETELKNVSASIITLYDISYPGDFSLQGDTSYRLFKGDIDITGDYAILDAIKAETGLEMTLFYQDTRILTTITSKDDNSRIVGSGAPDTVIEDVLNTGEAHFYSKTRIHGATYLTYYAPLMSSDGSVIGILGVCKLAADVDAAVQSALRPLIAIMVLLMLLVFLATFLYTRQFVASLLEIHSFLKKAEKGDLSAKMSKQVLDRHDELGETAKSAVTMQQALRTLVELDALTTLPNRRTGDMHLTKLLKESIKKPMDFCVCIGDIDFFKRVNDTYGHECGDMVLKNVAAKLKAHMKKCGFVARWGGEEFLLIFENRTLQESVDILEGTLADIRASEVNYEGQIVKVTMTFGIAYGSTTNKTELLKSADDKLYDGKTAGRNRIVS